jgi:hypothetical protein
MVHRAIQSRRLENEEPRTWTDISKDHRFDFAHNEYRFAPVNAACWLVFNTLSGKYINTVLSSAAEAAGTAANYNNAVIKGQYVPVRMVPAHG